MFSISATPLASEMSVVEAVVGRRATRGQTRAAGILLPSVAPYQGAGLPDNFGEFDEPMPDTDTDSDSVDEEEEEEEEEMDACSDKDSFISTDGEEDSDSEEEDGEEEGEQEEDDTFISADDHEDEWESSDCETDEFIE
jgi:hypothetical protein